jgi:hypothetical protein
MHGHRRFDVRPILRITSLLLTVILAGIIIGCDGFLLGPLLDGESAQELSIDPESTVVAVDATVVFTAAGGYPPYTYSVVSGDGTVETSTGAYTAPSVDGAATLSVTDLVGNSRTATITITVPASTSVNYQIDSVTWATGTFTGQQVTGSFIVTNTGDDDGTHDIGWQVFASLDDTLDLGSDHLVDRGTHPVLDSGATADPIGFAGFWPSDADTYYLIALLATTPDDPLVSNNELADGGTAVSAPPPVNVDYTATSLTNAGSPAESGTPVSETFTITNSLLDDGISQVFWSAYISLDMTPGDPGDDLIDAGSVDPPAGGEPTGSISIDSGSWPTVGEDTTYFLVVEISASDEPGGNIGNNTSSAAFTITSPDVDYIVFSVSDFGTPVVTSSAVSEELYIRNDHPDAGSETVYWDARASLGDAVYDITEVPVQSGTIQPLAGNTTSALINITGSWPADAGEYYLVVRVSAADDTNTTNNDGASGTVEVNALLVDYTVSSISKTFPSVTTNSSVSENFVYRNSGGNSGTLEVSYTAYVHTLPVWDPGDPVIATEALGLGSWLGARSSSGEISIDGFWPAGAGTWYLTIEVAAADNSNLTNDHLTVGPFTANDPPDYSVTVPAFPVVDYGGHPLESISTASSDHSGSPLHQILVTELDSNDGLQDISWTVYESDDAILDGLDDPVAWDTIPRLLGEGSVLIDVDFPLPATWGYWYYFVTATAGDDSDLSNNSAPIGPVPVWTIAGNIENDTDEDDVLPQDADDFAVLLNPGDAGLPLDGDSVLFNGLIDESGMRDSFIVRTGPDTTVLRIHADWASAPPKDNLNLYLFDEAAQFVVASVDALDDNMEPNGGGYWVVSGLTSDSFYYLDAISLTSGDIGDSFTIEVIAGP